MTPSPPQKRQVSFPCINALSEQLTSGQSSGLGSGYVRRKEEIQPLVSVHPSILPSFNPLACLFKLCSVPGMPGRKVTEMSHKTRACLSAACGLMWGYHTHPDTHPHSAPPIHYGRKVSAGEHDIKLVYQSKMGVDQNVENQARPSRGVVRIPVVNVC